MSDWHAILAAETDSGRARADALRAFAAVDQAPTSLVEYQSAGRVLIVGPLATALSAAARLDPSLQRVVVATDPPGEDPDAPHLPGVRQVRGQVTALHGHLGRFDATVVDATGVNMVLAGAEARPGFDLVIDFSQPPLLAAATPPVGYFPVSEADHLERALREAPELVGTFEKPRYFSLNTDLCAHSRSSLPGCNRCLESCPTGAISAIEDFVRIDPYLCQGVGICATACPAGAIVFAYPRPRDLLLGIRQMLDRYRAAGGQRPVLLIHDDDAGQDLVAGAAPDLPEFVLPVPVEDIASTGMDVWLAAIAYGAEHVVLAVARHPVAPVSAELDVQLATTDTLLAAMGYGSGRVRRIEAPSGAALARDLAGLAPEPGPPPAQFATFDEKRGTLRLALEHLRAHAPQPVAETALAPGAPFGQVLVDTRACTLCMGCVQVCPSHALGDNPDLPQLGFTESLCLQCGLCERACPEDAITLAPRYVFDPEVREHRRVLNEEQPFHCIACGKPFATRSIITRMTEALSGHHMFRSEAERRRLRMCGDCRVKDMFTGEREGGQRVN